MIILISPSKTMDYLTINPINSSPNQSTNPLTKYLHDTLLSLDYDSLKTLYQASDKVIKEAINANQNNNHYKSIELFNGAVFKNLDYETLSVKEKDYIDNHIYIFSALYGIVIAKDGISPYRLDLNNSLKPDIDNLTKQWKPFVNDFLKEQNADYIIDLASSEYRKLIDRKNYRNYIIIDFKDYRNGSYKTVGTFAKMARGQFLREMAINNVASINEIKELSVMDYTFNKELSSECNFIFTR